MNHLLSNMILETVFKNSKDPLFLCKYIQYILNTLNTISNYP